jgi:hypothetical protein
MAVVKYGWIALALWIAALTVEAQTEAPSPPADVQKNVMFSNPPAEDDDINDDDASMQADLAAANEVVANTATLQGDSSEDFDRD